VNKSLKTLIKERFFAYNDHKRQKYQYLLTRVPCMTEHTGTQRLYWLDNLRTFMIFLVVLAHASVVYEKYSMGADWWIVVDPASNDVPGILFLILNIFIIATIFFVSGYLTPRSLMGKTSRGFIAAKFRRLMIPWAVAILTLIPLYKVVFLYSRNLPQEHWTSYFHWNSLWSQNWLWFLPVLFLFDVIFFGLSKLPVSKTFITLKKGIWAALVVSVMYSFGMDYFGLHGWIKTFCIDFQNERLLIYFVVYLMGALCYRHKVLDAEWKKNTLDIVLHSTGWIPINLYIFMLIYGLVKPGEYLLARAVDILILRISFVFALAYLLYAMVTTFKRFFNKQGNLSRELNGNSYYVYIIHVIIMGGIAITMVNTGVPSLIKLLLLTIGTYLLSNVIVSLYRKVIARMA